MKREQEHVSHCLGHAPCPSQNKSNFPVQSSSCSALTLPPTAGLRLLSRKQLDQQKDLELSSPGEGRDGKALETSPHM